MCVLSHVPLSHRPIKEVTKGGNIKDYMVTIYNNINIIIYSKIKFHFFLFIGLP